MCNGEVMRDGRIEWWGRRGKERAPAGKDLARAFIYSSGPHTTTPSAIPEGSTQTFPPLNKYTVHECDHLFSRINSSMSYSYIAFPLLGHPTELSSFLTVGTEVGLSNPYALKDGSASADMTAWTSAGLQPTTGYYPYDPTLAAYG
ncbi:hypothetical protein J437_LFUL003479 [Ladona fulva]|uniref:Uncharacterized protein n=1 Tax=Ladona fulva TaxID=123851 RepID=A0A8K0NVM3_LADFU|nr:hypothetical protein J437_LFUL003479 [Ladona fulva]